MADPDEYRRQAAWRDWPTLFDALPAVEGRTLLDLGCGVGDQAAELVARGAQVIGLDSDRELLAAARARGLAGAAFRRADLREPLAVDGPVDGIWCSFAAACFPDLDRVLAGWRRSLAPGGWIALTEVDDLFGHEPVRAETGACFAAYARDALAAGRYDFHAGAKLERHAERAGLTVADAFEVADAELAFDGPALPEVLEAWRRRLARMRPLRDALGGGFEAVRDDFLACLARADHRSRARVRFCLATA